MSILEVYFVCFGTAKKVQSAVEKCSFLSDGLNHCICGRNLRGPLFNCRCWEEAGLSMEEEIAPAEDAPSGSRKRKAEAEATEQLDADGELKEEQPGAEMPDEEVKGESLMQRKRLKITMSGATNSSGRRVGNPPAPFLISPPLLPDPFIHSI